MLVNLPSGSEVSMSDLSQVDQAVFVLNELHIIMKNENETNGAAAPLQSLPNVKEHAPPPLESDCAATEELHGGCCVSSC